MSLIVHAGSGWQPRSVGSCYYAIFRARMAPAELWVPQTKDMPRHARLGDAVFFAADC